ncbi:PREDICTED: V-set and transmembrane domain-containing protein 1 [Galeopterus variegatus]|uniref:V-set and transmembrane domain-containing protein 1 n=1 Tax=Galeopterus variegatus TaxID=482537 RepID=A0ABM0RN42_GALVR|nr:PREDICTED: V-set and transmembrane domain-containing protein 1 [Galeopterus variegatus]
MITDFLFLLCLGLCLGYEDEKKNEKLPKPSLSAWPSSVVERKSNVTLKCQSHFQNVTFMLGTLHDSRYKQEQNSAENKAEFPLTDLEPKDAGKYFCAYKTTASQEWSEKSEHLQLVVTDKHDGPGAPSTQLETRIIPVTILSCLSIFLLFFSVFFIYRCTQRGSSHEESSKRASHSKFSKQEDTVKTITLPEAQPFYDGAAEDPKGVTCTELNTNAPFEAASVPTEDPPGSCECATLKV